MTDMSAVIVPKSDQINADDLISGPRTIRISDVRIKGGQEQPVSIYFEGSDKAFRPCKSMSRVLVSAWGPDANAYVGRSLTLYRDPKVKWGGMEVGGIRVSHMSHIERDMVLALTETKGSRKPFVVKPLVADVVPIASDDDTALMRQIVGAYDAAPNAGAVAAVTKRAAKTIAWLADELPELHKQVAAAEQRALARHQPTPGGGSSAEAADPSRMSSGPVAEDDREGPEDSQRGEAHFSAGGNEIDPQEAKANEIIGLANAVATPQALAALREENRGHLNAMSDDLAALVHSAYERADKRVGGR